MNRISHLIALVLIGFSSAAQSDVAANLDDFIVQGMKQCHVPGLAVAIVHEGEVKFLKTYGVSDLIQGKPVDRNTMGMMGSTTKAVTALAIAMLVEDKKVQWEDKVHDLLPDFQVYDPYVQDELTVRDLLCHRAGLGNTDMLWFSGLAPEETLRRMRYAKPAYSFRGDYTYQNVMYLAAGAIIEKISGETWADYITNRIFDPLGMSRSVPYAADAHKAGNFLAPHHTINGEVQPIEQVTAELVAPAGDIWASIEDMTRWMQFLLDSSRVEGKKLLSAKTFGELFKPHTIVPTAKFYPTTTLTAPTWTTYGLGWFQQDYNGRALQFHTGSLPGLTAILGLVPTENFGVYVFGNLDHAEVRHAIMLKSIDLFLDQNDERAWNEEIFQLYHEIKSKSKKAKLKTDSSRVLHTHPRLSLPEYVGTYESKLYGQLTVTGEDSLTLVLNTALKSDLTHWHHETFQYQWTSYADPGLLTFGFSDQGKLIHINLFNERFVKTGNETK